MTHHICHDACVVLCARCRYLQSIDRLHQGISVVSTTQNPVATAGGGGGAGGKTSDEEEKGGCCVVQ